MATFFRTSAVWVIDFQYEGRARRWLKAWPDTADARSQAQALLHDLYGAHARLVDVRRATEQEDAAFRRGDLPRNAWCPSGKTPLTEPRPPRGSDPV